MLRIFDKFFLGLFFFVIILGVSHGEEQKPDYELKIKIYKEFTNLSLQEDKVIWVLWSIPKKNVSMKKETEARYRINQKMLKIQNQKADVIIRELAECSWRYKKLDQGFEQHFSIYIKDDVEYYIKITARDGVYKLSVFPIVFIDKNDRTRCYSHLMPRKLCLGEVESNKFAGFLNANNEMIYLIFSADIAPLSIDNLYNADFSLSSYEGLDYPTNLKSKLSEIEIVNGEIAYGLYDDVECVTVDGRNKKLVKVLKKKLKSICINRLVGIPQKYYLKTKITLLKGKK